MSSVRTVAFELDDPTEHHDDSEPPSRRPTQPPRPTYPMLRDSCQSLHVGEGPSLDDEPAPPSSHGLAQPDGVPTVLLSGAELEWVSLDAESVSLLSAMNGVATVRAIAMICGVEITRACALVARLAARGVVRT